MVHILKAFVAQAQDTPAAACMDVHKLALREWKTPAWHGRMVAASQASSKEKLTHSLLQQCLQQLREL
jgi:hypothetical protein